MLIGAGNEDMAAAWDGEEGDQWTADEERYTAASSNYDRHLLTAAEIAPSSSVLDIGCGCGTSTRAAARIATQGSVLGVDLSSQMLERARMRSEEEGLTNVEFLQADAQAHPFDEAAHDIAISRFGAMFFADPTAAFANIGRALRPGGRLAVLAWRSLAENEWLTALRSALALGRALPEPPPGAPGPVGLADPERTRGLLIAAGFEEVEIEPRDEAVVLGPDAEDTLAFAKRLGFTKGMLEGVDDSGRAQAYENLAELIAEHDTGQGIELGSGAWLITARRPVD